jgi:hypothetical protein
MAVTILLSSPSVIVSTRLVIDPEIHHLRPLPSRPLRNRGRSPINNQPQLRNMLSNQLHVLSKKLPLKPLPKRVLLNCRLTQTLPVLMVATIPLLAQPERLLLMILRQQQTSPPPISTQISSPYVSIPLNHL